MVRESSSNTIPNEKIEIDVQGGSVQLWFPDLSTDERYALFQELVVGKLKGIVVWDKVENTDEEYAFHFDNL